MTTYNAGFPQAPWRACGGRNSAAMVYTESEPTGSEIWDVTKKIVDNMKREDLPDDVTDVTGAGARKEEL